VSQVVDIRTLQEIDDEASALRAALDDVERRQKGSEELDAARTRFAAAESELNAARKEQRRMDGEVDGLTAKITPEEKRLYDGSVRNPKELGNIQHELENLKAARSRLEDALLEVLARVEAAESEHETSQKALARSEARRAAEETDLARESERLNAAIASSETRRTAQKAKILPRSLTVYEEVRRRHAGNAVARISGGNCGGCRVSVPETVRRRAFSGDELAQCPNCGRILYVG
jgi:predicted  nucleic acid-binding Zn-ribbon protein